MDLIVILSCVSKKLPYPANAEDMYLGSYFKGSLTYAKSLNPNDIFILSSKYGLLELDNVIEPYECLIKNGFGFKEKNPGIKILTREEKLEWDKKTLAQLRQKTDIENDTFVFLAGTNYTNHLRGFLKNIEEPMKGLRFGKRLKFLNNYY